MSFSSSGRAASGAFGLATNVDAREAVVTARLERDAQRCYQLFCDAEAIPRWLHVVRALDVQARDVQGRPTRAAFVGELEQGSVEYTLEYRYDDAACRVAWEPTEDSRGVALSGSATFTARAKGGCLLRYSLCAALDCREAAWSDPLFQARPAEAVVVAFCEWVSASDDEHDMRFDDDGLDDVPALDDLSHHGE